MPTDALEILKLYTAWQAEPQLSEPELEVLLERFAIADPDGLPPGDTNWTPTYNLNGAAAEGWRWKAARASELHSSDLDGDRMSADQVFEHCMRMVKLYSRSAASPQIRSRDFTTIADAFFG